MARHDMSLAEYQEKWRNNPAKWSIVPASYAAHVLGKSLPSIEAFVEKGFLEAVIIEDNDKTWKGVTMSSLLQYPEKATQGFPSAENIYCELKKLAKRGDRIFYSELMDMFGLNYKNPHHRKKIGLLLCEVSEKSYVENKSMLSVVVVNKSTNVPSGTFFELAKKLKAITTYEDENEFFERQLRLVFRCYA